MREKFPTQRTGWSSFNTPSPPPNTHTILYIILLKACGLWFHLSGTLGAYVPECISLPWRHIRNYFISSLERGSWHVFCSASENLYQLKGTSIKDRASALTHTTWGHIFNFSNRIKIQLKLRTLCVVYLDLLYRLFLADLSEFIFNWNMRLKYLSLRNKSRICRTKM